MDCSTPGFPVHHHLPELTQTHVHPVGDAIGRYSNGKIAEVPALSPARGLPAPASVSDPLILTCRDPDILGLLAD